MPASALLFPIKAHGGPGLSCSNHISSLGSFHREPGGEARRNRGEPFPGGNAGWSAGVVIQPTLPPRHLAFHILLQRRKRQQGEWAPCLLPLSGEKTTSNTDFRFLLLARNERKDCFGESILTTDIRLSFVPISFCSRCGIASLARRK